MKCDSRASLLTCTFVSHCLGHEPKVKVATYMISKKFVTFGVNGVYVFQGVRFRVTKLIFDGWDPHST
jgi:hypothetical protein